MKLRHDINFDRDLHFRPIDGDRCLKKRQTQNEYWSAIDVELYLYKVFYGNTELAMLPRHVDVSKLKKTIQNWLPLMFETFKEIVTSLVLERDREAIQSDLDVDAGDQETTMRFCEHN